PHIPDTGMIVSFSDEQSLQQHRDLISPAYPHLPKTVKDKLSDKLFGTASWLTHPAVLFRLHAIALTTAVFPHMSPTDQRRLTQWLFGETTGLYSVDPKQKREAAAVFLELCGFLEETDVKKGLSVLLEEGILNINPLSTFSIEFRARS